MFTRSATPFLKDLRYDRHLTRVQFFVGNRFSGTGGNEKFLEFRNFPDFSIGKRFEIQISVFDIFRPDFGVFRPENVVGDRKL